ncbi:MAG: YgiQ family radical SAM protein, partial [Oscillospiraceae bacterium]
MAKDYLPINRIEMENRGWNGVDFVVVTGDAYVDLPSFGTAIISRLVESLGFTVGVLAQPDFKNEDSFKEFGKPRFGFLIGGGNVDSMVAHYTVAKKARTTDSYSPGGVMGKRPDRSATVYSQLAKKAYPDVPVILGGLEASLRRFAHYDYWQDTVLPSIMADCKADLVTFGMGERQTTEICTRLSKGENISTITDVAGTCFIAKDTTDLPKNYVECAGFEKVKTDKIAYAKACKIQMDNQDVVTGKAIVQRQTEGYLVQNVPAKPLNPTELDKIYALPFMRGYHPSYEKMGGVPAIEEVQFSIIQNRGCFGGCNFCAITMHQGRRVTARSKKSIVDEAIEITEQENFKGYIHDIGGPTANFRQPSCAKQMKDGMCAGKKCLAPNPCNNLIVDHREYLEILREVRALPKVKKVFIRSGIRYDYLIYDRNDEFFKELINHHISGQLKVAPEHCAPETLKYMGKP